MTTEWKWKIVYEGGTSITSLEMEPKDVEPFGVLAIGQPKVDYSDLLWNEVYYIYRSDRGFWTRHDKEGMIDQLAHFVYFIEAVCFGRDTYTSEMRKVVEDLGREMRGR